jgi:phosphate transport system substrate-binding protein
VIFAGKIGPSRGFAVLLILMLAGCGETGSKPSESGGKSVSTSGTKEVSPNASGAANGELAGLSGSVEIDGSSTVYLVTEAVAARFMKATGRKVNVSVGIAGTGGGFKRFCIGETDISDASRPILQAEIDKARENNVEFVELPICFDALTVAVHPSNKLKSITVAELRRMWEPAAKGKVMSWNQVNPAWPDEKLKLFGAGTDSGTFDYFTEAIVGKVRSSRTDYSPSEDDNTIVQGIAGTKTALGYLPFGYYEANTDKLKALAIDWEERSTGPVLPTRENAIAGKYIPLTRPLFIYVNRKSAGRPEVKAFVEFYLKGAAEFAASVKYIPLPANAYPIVQERFAGLQTGSGFGGVQEIGLSAEELLKRELK